MEIKDADERALSLARGANIPSNTRFTHRLDKFRRAKGNLEAYQAAVDFISPDRPHHFLTLVGERGRGKTHLTLGVAWNLIETRQMKVKYFQVEELLDDLRSGYHAASREEFDSFDRKMKTIKYVPLLILDDMGVEQSTEWARAKLDLIVDSRYLNNQLTIFTTNLAIEELAPRLASRMKEGVVILIEAQDFREVKAKARRKNVAGEK